MLEVISLVKMNNSLNTKPMAIYSLIVLFTFFIFKVNNYYFFKH